MMHTMGSSTTLTTPSPADRNPTRPYSSIAPASRRSLSNLPAPSSAQSSPAGSPYASAYSTPGRSVAPTGNSGVPTTASKSVRFSPAYSAFQSSFTPTSAPPSRLVGPGPSQSTGINPLLFRSSSTPSLSAVPSPSPSKSVYSSAPSTPVSAPTVKSKSVAIESLPPLGRGVVARRLRVNSVLLVFWWLSSRTNLYGFASGHLVQVVPSLDTPLHFLESSVLLLLFYNICESMYKLNELASISPSSSAPSLRSTPKRNSPSSSPFGTPMMQSSPKTRSALSMTPSPTVSRTLPPGSPSSPFRASVRSSPTPVTPQTPSSMPRVSTALRRSTLAAASPSPSSSGVPTGLGIGLPESREPSSLVKAYYARHPSSPDFKSSLSSSVSSRQDIERLLMD